MLYLIGTGLNDTQDLTLRSITALTHSTHVFIDNYTSISNLDLTHLSTLIGNKEIKPCCRDYIESLNEIYTLALHETVSLLIIGTPFFATTHTQIICDCISSNIPYQIIHNASISNVTGSCGLFSYNYGKTVSIPKFTHKTRFISFFENIKMNYENNLHTLVLLDIKTELNYFMTPNEAITQVRECGEYFGREYKIFVISRFGCKDEKIVYMRMDEVEGREFGKPLHSLIFPGRLEVYEEEAVEIMFKDKD